MCSPLASLQPPCAGCGAREVGTARPPVASSLNQRPGASVRDQQQCLEDIRDRELRDSDILRRLIIIIIIIIIEIIR